MTRSASIEFPYALRSPRAGSGSYPAVMAEMPTPGGFYPLELLLDSGADCSVLPMALGRLAGVNFRKLPKITVRGIEGRGVRAYQGQVRLRLCGLILPPIPCLYGVADDTPMLLGRDGFFELFNITLDNRRKKTVLRRLF